MTEMDLLKTIENKSKIYTNGSKWITNNHGEIEILGRLNNRSCNSYYICKFEDGTMVEASLSSIKTGEVKNPNGENAKRKHRVGCKYKTNNGIVEIVGYSKKNGYVFCKLEDGNILEKQIRSLVSGKIFNPFAPTIYGIGYIGDGEYKTNDKEGALWIGMLARCYRSASIKKRPSYEKVEVCKRWLCLQHFAEDIKKIDGYSDWKKSKKPREYHLDKDVLCEQLRIDPKIYSSETCKFITKSENSSEVNKRTKITGLTYLATRLNDNYTEEFTNQREFARKWDLLQTSVSACIRYKKGTDIHRGWKFGVIHK